MHIAKEVCTRESTKEWLECAYEIHLIEGVEFKVLARMKTPGQYINQYGADRIIYVPLGKIRLTRDFLEGKDSMGIPFGWNKKLIKKVVSQEGRLLWWPD